MVRLDETQQLELAASAVAVDGRILRIAIDRVGWTWINYGASERHQ
jgi:hypothetical protein